MTTKICTKCNCEKELIEFGKNKNNKDGLSFYCKKCKNLVMQNSQRSKDGLVTKIYSMQKFNSKKRGHKPPYYSKDGLKNWIFNHNNFETLYQNWVKSNYDKNLVPSVDRLDDYKGYSFDNIRLVAFKDNMEKAYFDMKNGINNKLNKSVFQYDLQGNLLKEYYSEIEASRQTNIHRYCIRQCVDGKQKSAGGFIWK